MRSWVPRGAVIFDMTAPCSKAYHLFMPGRSCERAHKSDQASPGSVIDVMTGFEVGLNCASDPPGPPIRNGTNPKANATVLCVDSTLRSHREFSTAHASSAKVRRDHNELRFVSIGPVDGEIITVVWTPRDHGVCRIISAWPASRRERRMYCNNREKK
ncbi:MAG: BrnT family toxin [Candidatus Baltobacteraceae bacterium]